MQRLTCLVMAVVVLGCEPVEPRRSNRAADIPDTSASAGGTADSATAPVAPPAPAAPRTPPESAQLLQPGDHHPGRVNTVTGETWLGLFEGDSGWALKATDVTVVAIPHACTDTAGQKSGRRVGVDAPTAPLFLVRGVPGLRAIAVRTLLSERQQLFPGQRRELELGTRGARWTLAAYGSVPPPPPGRAAEGGIREYSLVASRQAGRTQTVYAFRVAAGGAGLNAPPTVLWAGDLNGDGQLDLFVDLTTGQQPGPLVLFASSPADTTQLVRKVAEYQPGSC